MNEIAKGWVDKAENDFDAARHIRDFVREILGIKTNEHGKLTTGHS
jgi:hypothetical protein